MIAASSAGVAVCCLCCSVFQCVAACCSVLQTDDRSKIRRCSIVLHVLQCVAECCSVLPCVAVRRKSTIAPSSAAVRCSVLQHVSVCCSVLQCVAVCCSVLQRVVECCRVSQTTNLLTHHPQRRGSAPAPRRHRWLYNGCPTIWWRRRCPRRHVRLRQYAARRNPVAGRNLYSSCYTVARIHRMPYLDIFCKRAI